MFTEKISFKINTVLISQELTSKTIFLCFQVDNIKFYSSSQKKISHHSNAKFYGEIVEIRTPKKELSIAIIDNTNKSQLKLLKRIQIAKSDLLGKKTLNHSFKEEGFQLKFQSKIVDKSNTSSSESECSLQDSQTFQDQTVDLYKIIAMKKQINGKQKSKQRKESGQSSLSTLSDQYFMKRSRKYSQELTDCCSPFHQNNALYEF